MRQYENAGELVRIQMVRCGYTLETLAQQTRISKNVLQGILSGRANTISTRNTCFLASAFGYSMADFIDYLSGNLPEDYI